MLALKSYEQNNGFSVMSADELYFINGGSGQKLEAPHEYSAYQQEVVDNPGKMVVASIIATITTIDNPYEHTTAVRDGLYEAFGGTYSYQ